MLGNNGYIYRWDPSGSTGSYTQITGNVDANDVRANDKSARSSGLGLPAGHIEIIGNDLYAMGRDGSVRKWNVPLTSDPAPTSSQSGWVLVAEPGGTDSFARGSDNKFYVLGNNGYVYRWDPLESFNFSISTEGNKSVVKGTSVSNTATVRLLSGTPQPVIITIGVRLLPIGVDVSFPQGQSCTPNLSTPCTVTFTLQTHNTATPGTYAIPISGSGGGVGRDSLPFNLNVTDANHTLTVNREGTSRDGGTVTSAPEGIICGSTCSANFASGMPVTLTATLAEGGFTFAGWDGDCKSAGIGASCTLTMDAAKNVTARFNSLRSDVNYTLTVNKSGTAGSDTIFGMVTDNIDPHVIENCVSFPCSGIYPSGANVTLTATPISGFTFGGWSGICTGTQTCAVTMDAAKTVTAIFNVSGGGRGTLLGRIFIDTNGDGKHDSGELFVRDSSKAACGTNNEVVLDGFVVDYRFSGGGVTAKADKCNGGGPYYSASVPAGGPHNIGLTVLTGYIVTFGNTPITITGGGTTHRWFGVKPPAGPLTLLTINPTSGPVGTLVTITGVGFTTTSNSNTVNFGGIRTPATLVNNTLRFTVPSATLGLKNVSVTNSNGRSNELPFRVDPPNTRPLTLIYSKSFDGQSETKFEVNKDIFGKAQNAGANAMLCSEVTVHPTVPSAVKPDLCNTPPNNYVRMDNLKEWTKPPKPQGSFDKDKKLWRGLTKWGDYYNPNSLSTSIVLPGVKLKIHLYDPDRKQESNKGRTSAVVDYVAGGTTGGGPLLTVTRIGNGTVTSAPQGINCSPTCSANFPSGTRVTLTANPTSVRWSGGCSSATNVTTVTMDANKTCTATFSTTGGTSHTLTVTKSGTGSGTVTDNATPSILSCSSNQSPCLATYSSGMSVTLTAEPISSSTFDGWGGVCSGAGTARNCTVIMSAAKHVSARFNTTVSGRIDGWCSPIPNECFAGGFQNVPDSASSYLWKCVGSGGGTTASCSAPLPTATCTDTGNNNCPVITTTSLPVAKPCNEAQEPGSCKLVPYNAQLAVRGGESPYVFEYAATGTSDDNLAVFLSAGLRMSPSGAITGVVGWGNSSGSITFGARVTDADRKSTISILNIIVHHPDDSRKELVIGSRNAPAGTVGTHYANSYTALGGTPPYTWNVSGTLPPGLAYGASGDNNNTWTISGTPTFPPGTYSHQLSVSDKVGGIHTYPGDIGIKIYAAPMVDLKANGQDTLSVSSGTLVTLSWNATNARGCVASGDWSGFKTISGSEEVNVGTSNKTYSLLCEQSNTVSVRDTVAVTVMGTNRENQNATCLKNGCEPFVDLTVKVKNKSPEQDQITVAPGTQVSIIWEQTGGVRNVRYTCVKSGAWSGNLNSSSSESQPFTINQNSVFSVSCHETANSSVVGSTDNVRVNVTRKLFGEG